MLGRMKKSKHTHISATKDALPATSKSPVKRKSGDQSKQIFLITTIPKGVCVCVCKLTLNSFKTPLPWNLLVLKEKKKKKKKDETLASAKVIKINGTI